MSQKQNICFLLLRMSPHFDIRPAGWLQGGTDRNQTDFLIAAAQIVRGTVQTFYIGRTAVHIHQAFQMFHKFFQIKFCHCLFLHLGLRFQEKRSSFRRGPFAFSIFLFLRILTIPIFCNRRNRYRSFFPVCRLLPSSSVPDLLCTSDRLFLCTAYS